MPVRCRVAVCLRLGTIVGMPKLPTVGRTVMYHFDEGGERRARPAVVVDVNDKGDVELVVAFSSRDPGGAGYRGVGIVEGADEPGLSPAERRQDRKELDRGKLRPLEPCWTWPVLVDSSAPKAPAKSGEKAAAASS
jgi:hypothetical protein